MFRISAALVTPFVYLHIRNKRRDLFIDSVIQAPIETAEVAGMSIDTWKEDAHGTSIIESVKEVTLIKAVKPDLIIKGTDGYPMTKYVKDCNTYYIS